MFNKNHFVSALSGSSRITSTWHGNDQDSNFKQLLTCRAENDPVFSEWLNRKNKNFTLPEIQNEILKELSLSILRIIVESIKNADFHNIMV